MDAGTGKWPLAGLIVDISAMRLIYSCRWGYTGQDYSRLSMTASHQCFTLYLFGRLQKRCTDFRSEADVGQNSWDVLALIG